MDGALLLRLLQPFAEVGLVARPVIVRIGDVWSSPSQPAVFAE